MITVEHLTKCYGDFKAVDDLSFEIDEGHIYGFLGPNGAGKSTTMNIMTGCLSATEGTVKIDGYDIFEDADKAKKLIGYLPEQPPLYLNETPLEYLRFVGEAKGVKGAALNSQIDEVMERTRITEMKNRRINNLSKGYRQRVGIAQALLGNPEVIILDEPTVGLDPIQIIEIRDLIKELGETHTVILSSHILSEVQAICDQIMIISKGKLRAFGKPEELMEQMLSPDEITITAEASADETSSLLSDVTGVTEVTCTEKENGYTSAHVKTDADDIYDVSRAIFFAFADARIPLLEMSLKEANLEDVFLELTESDEESGSGEDTGDEENDGSDGEMSESTGAETDGGSRSEPSCTDSADGNASSGSTSDRADSEKSESGVSGS